MNYMVYVKAKDDKRFQAMDLSTKTVADGLVYATLIPNLERAKYRADVLAQSNEGVIFQVRVAGTNKVVHTAQA
jgi:hypothetical protein